MSATDPSLDKKLTPDFELLDLLGCESIIYRITDFLRRKKVQILWEFDLFRSLNPSILPWTEAQEPNKRN